MGNGICSVDDCERPISCRGWCSKHYTRWRTHGDPANHGPQRLRVPNPICSVEGCEEKHKSDGLCSMHHDRWYRTGRVDRPCKRCGVDVSGQSLYCSPECRSEGGFKDRLCVICGTLFSASSGRRELCSGRCQQLWHRASVAKVATCQRCGDLIDLLETGKAGRKRRADVKMCDACRKYKRSTRHGVSPHVLAKRDGFDCKLCGEPVDFDLPFPDRRSPSVDHVFPYAHGGSHELSNLQLAHLWCNHKKSNRVA